MTSLPARRHALAAGKVAATSFHSLSRMLLPAANLPFSPADMDSLTRGRPEPGHCSTLKVTPWTLRCDVRCDVRWSFDQARLGHPRPRSIGPNTPASLHHPRRGFSLQSASGPYQSHGEEPSIPDQPGQGSPDTTQRNQQPRSPLSPLQESWRQGGVPKPRENPPNGRGAPPLQRQVYQQNRQTGSPLPPSLQPISSMRRRTGGVVPSTERQGSPVKQPPPDISSNIYRFTEKFRNNTEFECYTFPWPEDVGEGHVKEGRTIAKTLRAEYGDFIFVYTEETRAIAALRTNPLNRPELPLSLELTGSFFGGRETIVLRKGKWGELREHPQNGDSLNAEGTGPSALTQAEALVHHLLKEQVQSASGSQVKGESSGPGTILTGNTLTAIDFNGVPAVMIDFVCKAGIPLHDVLKGEPTIDLMGAVVRAASGHRGTVTHIQPLTEDKRRFLLEISKVPRYREAIRAAPLTEIVYTMEDKNGGKLYEWIGELLTVEEHASSKLVGDVLGDLETPLKREAKVPPRQRQKIIASFAAHLAEPPDGTDGFINSQPLSSGAASRSWGPWSYLVDSRCFGRVNTSPFCREFGKGLKVPLDPRPWTLLDALNKGGLYRVKGPPVKLGVLCVAGTRKDLDELQSLSSVQTFLDRVHKTLYKLGVVEGEVVQRTLVTDAPKKTVPDLARAAAEDGAGLLLVLSGFGPNTTEGNDLWLEIKKARCQGTLPSQLVERTSLWDSKTKKPLPDDRVDNVLVNVLISSVLKLRHIPWRVTPSIPGPPSVLDHVNCVVGIDVCKGSMPGKKQKEDDRSAGVTVLSRGGELSFKFTHDRCDGETVTEDFLIEAIPGETVKGQRVAVVRHGLFRGAEVEQILRILEANSAQGTFIEIIERNSIRIFSGESKHAPEDTYLMTSPTSCFLVASTPFTGTAQPIRVVLGRNDLGLTQEQAVELVALSRRMPNSAISPKLPFWLHLTDKLAYTARQVGKEAESGCFYDLSY